MTMSASKALRDKATQAVKKARTHNEVDIAGLVSDWCKRAKAPQFDNVALPQIIKIIRDLLSVSTWRDDFAKENGVDPVAQRRREVVEALRVLRAKLPQFIEDFRDSRTPTPQETTLSLYELVKAHQPWIDALPPVSRGAPPSRERNVTSHIALRAYELWKGMGLQGQADAFAAEAVTWLLSKPQSDAAISRGRRRRA